MALVYVWMFSNALASCYEQMVIGWQIVSLCVVFTGERAACCGLLF